MLSRLEELKAVIVAKTTEREGLTGSARGAVTKELKKLNAQLNQLLKEGAKAMGN
jgi:hypothetical protein